MTLVELSKAYKELELKKSNVKTRQRKDYYIKKQLELTNLYRELNKDK